VGDDLKEMQSTIDQLVIQWDIIKQDIENLAIVYYEIKVKTAALEHMKKYLEVNIFTTEQQLIV